ncbi:hypothetical protein [Hydrogenophaga sp.]|uniref:hypothetical protein n=1 Tax=Hydrogenophaga sp. TaxID=1904254 RepID=UPI00271E1EAE|nr:hypothetical protein [Hydrogenophaga sp.]MDO9436914.1 hypothetical protein [Hydrogenophaga sp.]
MSTLSTRGQERTSTVPVRTVENELVIGAHALQGKDATVLQVLVRLLDGSMTHRLRFSDQLDACNIVFTSPQHATALPGVVVQVADHPHPPNAPCGGIEVPTPLRMSCVMGALHQALAVIHAPTVADPAAGLLVLFDRVRRCMGMGNPSRSVVPLDSGFLMLIDAQQGRLQTAAPLDQLLTGNWNPGTWRPAGLRDEELLHDSPTHALRDFVWQLAQRLVDVGAAPPPLTGTWRLRRWPEAAGLKAHGHPRLAALMTAQHHTVDELGAASGLPPLTVQWFVQCCQLFGLTEQRDVGKPASVVKRLATPNATPGWIGQLRERLRLW